VEGDAKALSNRAHDPQLAILKEERRMFKWEAKRVPILLPSSNGAMTITW
jgi:hypothetical protein